MTEARKDIIRQTDAEAIRLAKSLIHGARYGALAVLDPQGGAPMASRVGVASDSDGAPLILISMLAAHTPALLADPRCSILLGEPGKGDPLAHPRITIECRAARLEAGSPARLRASRRYLNRNPKAKLYAGLGDFSFFRLEPQRASLNGGFGKAYLIGPADILIGGEVVAELDGSEQSALDHMNAEHRDAVALYARHFAGENDGDWSLVGLDAEGIDIAAGDRLRRIFFEAPLASAADLRPRLVEMVRQARNASHV